MASHPDPGAGPCRNGHPASARVVDDAGRKKCRLCAKAASKNWLADKRKCGLEVARAVVEVNPRPSKRAPHSPATSMGQRLHRSEPVDVGTVWLEPRMVAPDLSEEELLSRRADYALGLRLTGHCRRCGEGAAVHGNLSYAHRGCSGFQAEDGHEMLKKQKRGRVVSNFAHHSGRLTEEEPS